MQCCNKNHFLFLLTSQLFYHNWDNITAKKENIDHKGLEVYVTDVYKLDEIISSNGIHYKVECKSLYNIKKERQKRLPRKEWK